MMYLERRACQCGQPRRNPHQLTTPLADSAVKLDQLLWRKRMHGIHGECACWPEDDFSELYCGCLLAPSALSRHGPASISLVVVGVNEACLNASGLISNPDQTRQATTTLGDCFEFPEMAYRI